VARPDRSLIVPGGGNREDYGFRHWNSVGRAVRVGQPPSYTSGV
jgi:hypothetical protein